CSIACPPSIRARCMHSGTASTAPMRRRLRPSSTPSTGGCPPASQPAPRIRRGSRAWRRPGSGSTTPRARSTNTISSANRWSSTSSAGLPRPRAVDTYRRRDRACHRKPPSSGLRPYPRNRSMADKPRYYLPTAIAYPNGPPHIGHAYEAIATDAIARFMRLDGYDVLFVTGTDEHGIKMLQTAAKEKLTPPQLVERNVPRFKTMVERLDCSNDQFIRTTEERHHRASIAIWQQMEAAGDISLGKYSGWYSVRDEAYYDEDETRLNDAGERVGPQGTPVEWVEEESYFFKLSAYQRKLLDLYARHPDFVLPRERLNEVLAFVKGGLQDLSISRTTFDWGVKVPGNPKHVMYVWVDALTNYITAVAY